MIHLPKTDQLQQCINSYNFMLSSNFQQYQLFSCFVKIYHVNIVLQYKFEFQLTTLFVYSLRYSRQENDYLYIFVRLVLLVNKRQLYLLLTELDIQYLPKLIDQSNVVLQQYLLKCNYKNYTTFLFFQSTQAVPFLIQVSANQILLIFDIICGIIIKFSYSFFKLISSWEMADQMVQISYLFDLMICSLQFSNAYCQSLTFLFNHFI
eukprot:TRINITY_DN5830_c1_g1_i1.p1 TRINITY_DN5830_c1_g1~~TRINITY_DN5830_c1_g1_i1.p1  ORF type:complete len:207 (+),score=-22.02 TRINITY_DN5830_c1_g1_i1:558-1178(+)